MQLSIERHKRKKASRRVEEWLTVRNKELRGCKREEEEERRRVGKNVLSTKVEEYNEKFRGRKMRREE